MSSEQPHQGGYGGQPGYGAPGAPGGYGAPVQFVPARPASHRGAWIGAGATLLAAVIGVVGTYVVTSNNTPPAPPAAQGPAPSATTAGAPGGEAASPAASQSPDTSTSPESQGPGTAPTPPAKPAGTVEWQGALAITYADAKDLDSAPPVESEINEENDFSIHPFGTSHMLNPEGGTKALVWKDSTKAPSHTDCAGVVDTLGTTASMKMKTGLVLCARTNDGRLARLTVKELTGQANDMSGVFDVVVWSG
ncbi:hypothetical protein [Streptomyces sp. NPDC058326]|uniref:hypothetical protein n=1 Tax=Streptomyces sp. NPDC058326 TaxID=3346447 RepID=UPI0036E9FFB1